MPRKARKTLDSNVLKITQATNGLLFRDDGDRDFFLDRLEKVQDRYQCRVLAFCCAQENGFQLVIDTQGANISKMMQSLTIAYAMYRASNDKLFTQRYKSEALHSNEAVKQAVEDILQSTEYSGCCFKLNQTMPFNWVKVSSKKLYQAHPARTLIKPENAQQILNDWLSKNGCTHEEIKKDKHKRNQCMIEFRQKHDCSLKVLADLFDLSESSASKIIKHFEQDT